MKGAASLFLSLISVIVNSEVVHITACNHLCQEASSNSQFLHQRNCSFQLYCIESWSVSWYVLWFLAVCPSELAGESFRLSLCPVDVES